MTPVKHAHSADARTGRLCSRWYHGSLLQKALELVGLRHLFRFYEQDVEAADIPVVKMSALVPACGARVSCSVHGRLCLWVQSKCVVGCVTNDLCALDPCYRGY